MTAVASVSAPPGGSVPQQTEQVVARARPAVVLVEVVDSFGDKSHGSGFVFDANGGYILTNHHVIEGAKEIKVTLSDGRSFPAGVVDFKRFETANWSQLVDAAVLRIGGGRALAALPLRSAKPVRDGQEVLVLGYPGGIETDRMSVTRGIVSAVRDGWIETDAVIVPGNSGGPMIDSTGHVIGLATFVTGHSRRFGGATWIEEAAVLAARAVDPNGYQLALLDVPGIEFFLLRDLTSRDFKRLLVKSWRVSGDRSESGTEGIEAVGFYFGPRRYVARPSIWYWPEQTSYVDSTGSYLISDRIDLSWVRTSKGKVTEAMLPLRVGESWDRHDTWRRSPINGIEAQPLGYPTMKLPTSAEVDERTTVESLKDLVTVPAGSYRDCVRIRRERIILTNERLRERRVETMWYAAGVGLVKKVSAVSESDGVKRETWELERVQWLH